MSGPTRRPRSAGSGSAAIPGSALFDRYPAEKAPEPATIAFTDIGTIASLRPEPMLVTKAGRLFGAYLSEIFESVNDGASYQSVHNFVAEAPAGVYAMRVTDDGEMLVAMRRSVGGLNSSLWRSTGFSANAATATWANVLTIPNNNAEIIDRCLDVWGKVVLVSAYTTTPKSDSRYAYLSTDYGATFTQVFDLHDHPVDPDFSNAHVHGVCVDPWEDKLWISTGDGNNKGIWMATLDKPTTWTKVIAEQPTTLIPTRAGILVGMDNAPYGLQRVRRWGATGTPKLEPVWTSPDGTIGRAITWRGRVGDPILAGFGPLNMAVGAGHGYVAASGDGENFYQLAVDALADADFLRIVGPTDHDGDGVGTLHAIRTDPAGGNHHLRATAPTWLPKQAEPRLAKRHFVSADRFGQNSGSPNLSIIAALWRAQNFDPVTNESVIANVQVPEGWKSFHVDLLWANAGAGAGDVVWRLGYKFATGAGFDLSATGFSTPANATATAGAVNSELVTTLTDTPLVAPVAGTVMALRMERLANQAGDTLANDAAALGLYLRKVN